MPVGDYLTSRNRLAQMLTSGQQMNNGTNVGGLASVLQQGLAGYMQGADARDKKAAQSAMMQALLAGPTTQIQQLPEGTMGPPNQRTISPYENAASALAAMPENEYAAQYAQPLLMKKFEAEQAAADEAKRAQIRREEFDIMRGDKQAAMQSAADLRREQWTRDEALRRDLANQSSADRRFAAQMAVANRPPQSPVSIMGPDGKPLYVPPSQAYGQRPYNEAQAQKDIIKLQQGEQARIGSQQVLDQAAALYAHPGREIGTGASSFMSAIPGTEAKGFKANLDTFKAQTFVPMVSALKGMGALSDAEGRKLTDSVGALDPSMPEAEFANSLQKITRTLYEKGRASGLNLQLPDFAAQKTTARQGQTAGGAKFLGFE